MPSTASLVRFEDLHLSSQVLKALQDVGYETPSPIQAQTIPCLLEGRDVLGQSQTGTGKTAAFALPLLSRIDLDKAHPQVLVLVPTRELAIQVTAAFARYGAYMSNLKVHAIYGGQDYRTQLRALSDGVQVVVGTPGRVMDHMRRGTLKLDQLKSLVLDEADEMLRMGFIDDVEWVLEHTPDVCQMVLLSATMPKAIRDITSRYLSNPEKITIESKTATVASIEQLGLMVKGFQKIDVLSRLLEFEPFDGMIIFVRTKNATLEVSDHLKSLGYACAALNGDIAQIQRERIIKHLKQGKLNIVVATDVAARGIDVERVSHVLNYDIPTDNESYIHRIGRTGRAGRSGKAILFVKPSEKRFLNMIERATKQPIKFIDVPSAGMITQRRLEQFNSQITQTLESQDVGFFTKHLQAFQQAHQIPYEQIAAALAFIIDQKQPLRCIDVPSKHSSDDDKFARIKPRRERDSRDRDSREREPRARAPRRAKEGLERYRIEVGRAHGVRPGNIVGAIANEIDLNSNNIGDIDIHNNFSTVDLPKDLSKKALQVLKSVWVAGQQLQISKFDQAQGSFSHKHESAAPKKRQRIRPVRDNKKGSKKRERA